MKPRKLKPLKLALAEWEKKAKRHRKLVKQKRESVQRAD